MRMLSRCLVLLRTISSHSWDFKCIFSSNLHLATQHLQMICCLQWILNRQLCYASLKLFLQALPLLRYSLLFQAIDVQSFYMLCLFAGHQSRIVFFMLLHDNTRPITCVEDVTSSYWLTGLLMLIVLILWVLLWIISWVHVLIIWAPSPLKRGLPLILDVLRNER